ncbi:MAG: hypothetical protein I3273_01985 [Candidatus Moeniiplasma glomeromycotorum]|nr:hypothetical protein [Candidatus Moeniiplasma glomeromycotorum]MCE8167111.1 hypothetical protein [Candidatus Moeniiplasma glomeromycotorum]MCE8168877.1 hypothetical protein [Candidatus Moeniiplasma glomeromycotorum]
MSEIKIPFTKIEVKKIDDVNKPANAEGLELEIIPIFLNEFYEKVPPDTALTKIKIAFLEGAEKEIYNNLLDDSKEKFELSFEKEKVDFYVVGVEDRETDKTKLQIDYFALGEGKDSLQIFFKPQFAGIIKLTSISQPRPNEPDSPLLTTTTPNRLAS